MTNQIFLIEKSGPTRQAFGPYPSVAAAKAKKGVRYAVVSGELANGEKMTADALKTLINTGSIRLEDGTNVDGI